MSAFGPYSDVQAIDFAALGANGLYLITGDTGAGKTTIFDAISFALFGKASGEARDKYPMLRSHFAGEKAKTYVELDFASGSDEYSIKRAIRNTGQEVELKSLSGNVLYLPNGAVSGQRNVDPKVAEIIGLNHDQFAQIVMIAQNDFLRFLKSDTGKRSEILRHIFNTGKLEWFRIRLKECVKEEESKLALICRDFERYGVDVHRRDELFREWEEQIKTGKVELAEADGQLEKYNRQKEGLAAAFAVAEELCNKFSALAKHRLEREAHNAKTEEAAAKKARAQRGEIALRNVKPQSDKAQSAAADYSAAQTELAGAKAQETAAAAELEAAKKAAEALPPLEESRQALDALAKQWEQSDAKLKKISTLKNSFNEITITQKNLAALRTEYKRLAEEFTLANGKYEAIDSAFLAAQAGILAETLVPGEPCRVCGSTEHPAPAALAADKTVSEKDREKAKKEAELAREKRETKSAEGSALKANVQILTEQFLNSMSEFAADVTWETAETKFAELLSQTQRDESESAARRKTAEKAFVKLSADWDVAAKRKNSAETAAASAKTRVEERTDNAQKRLKIRDETQALHKAALHENKFADDAEYRAALVTDNELEILKKQISDYENSGKQLDRDITRLEEETLNKEQPDLEHLRTEKESADSEYKALSGRRDEIKNTLGKTESALKELRAAAIKFDAAVKSCADIKQLYGVASGKLNEKLSFETYVQAAYFDRVLHAANLRLKLMSQNRYALSRMADNEDGRKVFGLEIEVEDAHTGKKRSTKSLSGGESFMASLSLALGLSDVVQQRIGGVRLDAMFIDEGFGSLDTEVLELAVKTLSEMAGTNRIIGIISHVTELRERVDKQVRIEKTMTGSRVRVEA